MMFRNFEFTFHMTVIWELNLIRLESKSQSYLVLLDDK